MEASVAGTNSTSSHASQPSGTRPNLPAGPPVDCERPKITTSAGTANRLAWLARSKSSVAGCRRCSDGIAGFRWQQVIARSEEHTSELQSQSNLVCRLLLEKKKKKTKYS